MYFIIRICRIPEALEKIWFPTQLWSYTFEGLRHWATSVLDSFRVFLLSKVNANLFKCFTCLPSVPPTVFIIYLEGKNKPIINYYIVLYISVSKPKAHFTPFKRLPLKSHPKTYICRCFHCKTSIITINHYKEETRDYTDWPRLWYESDIPWLYENTLMMEFTSR